MSRRQGLASGHTATMAWKAIAASRAVKPSSDPSRSWPNARSTTPAAIAHVMGLLCDEVHHHFQGGDSADGLADTAPISSGGVDPLEDATQDTIAVLETLDNGGSFHHRQYCVAVERGIAPVTVEHLVIAGDRPYSWSGENGIERAQVSDCGSALRFAASSLALETRRFLRPRLPSDRGDRRLSTCRRLTEKVTKLGSFPSFTRS